MYLSDAQASFFSRRIRWTPPSFLWHNRVSAWLSLCVRRPIIAGGRVWMAYSIQLNLHLMSEASV